MFKVIHVPFLLLCADICVGVNHGAWSEPVGGLSFQDAPKYAPDFTHYDFANPNAPKGGEIRLIAIGSFDCINRTYKCTAPDGITLTQDTLMSRSLDEPFSLYPLIAQKVEVAPDASWVEFHLNPKARWHDGTPITVEDVIYSYATKKEKGLPAARLYYGQIDKIEQTGGHSLRLTLKKPQNSAEYNRELPLILALLAVEPKAYYENSAKSFEDPAQTAPLGSGPYKVKEVNLGRYVVYERVKDYWAKDLPVNRGRNNFDTVRYDYFRDNNAALQAFKAAQADVIRETSPSRWKESHRGPKYHDGTLKKVELVNDRPVGLRGFSFNTRKPLFEDRRVREALSLAFDRQWVKTHILPGFKDNLSFFDNTDLATHYGKPSSQELELIQAIEPTYDTSQLTLSMPGATPRENRRRALTLLQEAGWVLEDGVLVHKKTGQPFSFELVVSQPDEQKLALAFANNLKSLGIKVRISLVDAAQYEHRKQSRDYDMIASWWLTSSSPGNELQHYWSCAAKDNPGSRNYPGICDTMADKLMQRIPSLRTRQDMRTHAQALDRVLLSQHYLVPLFYNPKIYLGLHKKIHYQNSVADPVNGQHFWWAKQGE